MIYPVQRCAAAAHVKSRESVLVRCFFCPDIILNQPASAGERSGRDEDLFYGWSTVPAPIAREAFQGFSPRTRIIYSSDVHLNTECEQMK
jgi:hypothetical protein